MIKKFTSLKIFIHYILSHDAIFIIDETNFDIETPIAFAALGTRLVAVIPGAVLTSRI